MCQMFPRPCHPTSGSHTSIHCTSNVYRLVCTRNLWKLMTTSPNATLILNKSKPKFVLSSTIFLCFSLSRASISWKYEQRKICQQSDFEQFSKRWTNFRFMYMFCWCSCFQKKFDEPANDDCASKFMNEFDAAIRRVKRQPSHPSNSQARHYNYTLCCTNNNRSEKL
jgi:hypothetical protein